MRDSIEKSSKKNENNSNEGNMEDALEATGFGKFHIWITLTGGFLLIAINAESWSIGYVIPSATCDMDLNLQEKSILITVGAVGILTTQFFWGYMSDKIGRRNIMLYTLSAGCLCTMLSIIAPMFWMVAVLRYLNGTFVAGAAGLCFPYIGEFFSAKNRSLAIMIMSIFIGIALILIPSVAWLIIPQDISASFFGLHVTSWRIFVFVGGLPAILAWVTLYFSPESPKFLAQALRYDDALNVLRKMHKGNNNKDAYAIEKLSCEEVNNNEACIWELFNKQFIWKTLLVCTIQSGAFATSCGLFLWYPDILQKISQSNQEITVCQALNLPETITNATTDDMDNCEINLDSSVYLQNIFIGIAYTVGYITISALVKKVGIKAILISFLCIAGLATITLNFITQPVVVDILFLALLVLSGLCVVVVTAAVVEIYPTHLRGMAVCLAFLSGRLSTIVTSSLMGYLLQWNCEGTFMLFSAILIGCSAISFLLPTKG